MLHYASLLSSYIAGQLTALLLPLGSKFSAASLFSALCVAVVFLLLKRPPGKRRLKYSVMRRALFPRWLYRDASFRADVMFFLFNVLAFGTLFGWAVLSANYISGTVSVALTGWFGAYGGTAANALGGKSIATLAIFVAYELAYWLDHYLSHRVPVLWEFHKVHHTAEVLSPLTNFRVHPVDSLVFGNILGVFIGATSGVLHYFNFGTPFGVGASGSVILVAFIWLLGHLQHSHLWMPVTGPLGRVILSPAHHQIHHSDNPKHFNRNFGSCLSIWDWLFGTLHIPDREPEVLTFGVGQHTPSDHTAAGGMFIPFAMAWKSLRSPAEPDAKDLWESDSGVARINDGRD
jgi:sterol desaturase/sphingolipid hydroxylase (fatty acid hydroxylase superfamily)